MSIEFKDYYSTLGVTPKATSEEIKKAFRALARTCHPDVSGGSKDAEERFKNINEANEVLSDPESRRKYDRLGSDWRNAGESQPPQRPGRRGASASAAGMPGGMGGFQFEGTGFSDFFEQFFGGSARQGSGDSPFDQPAHGFTQARGKATPRGADIQGDILITLSEVLHGALRAISVRRPSGLAGHEETLTYQVRIPKGVLADQSLRVPGKGGEGAQGGEPGDILLRVRYAEHPDWRVLGSDLVGVVELAPWEAVLGATVRISTLDGSLSVKIPAGFQQGSRLRVRGKGLPTGESSKGDLYLEASIQVPGRIGKEEERLWKELAAASTFNPRATTHAS